MTSEKTPSTTSLPSNAIAIIGMAGRFPGAAWIDAFWENLRTGVESLERVDGERLPAATRDDPAYVPVRGILDDVAEFDAAFFGISPREADMMDPQQRVFLQCCWHALEDSGRIAERSTLVTGIYAGQSLNTYLLANLCTDRAFIDRITRSHQTGEFSVLFGNDPAFLATRVAHKLDLHGPALTVQTACSTSLVAVVEAVNSLLSLQCDLCLAGGVSISFPQERGHRFEEGSMVSPDGHCRPFDADAAGTVFGGGAGVVVLRRLEDAVAAGDRIHAVIRGAAVNNDGASKSSFSAPSVEGQCAAITTALTLADVAPDTIGYVEAHGTGTPMGDPIEVAAITRAFRDCGATGKQTCTLGSLKANIGHMEAAAGVAGLIKAALAVRDGIIPATLHYTKPNPHIDFAETPFRVSGETAPWPDAPHPRRAGVSSFGVGGTNAHVVVEQPPVSSAPRETQDDQPHTLLLSARDPEAVLRVASALADHLDTSSGENLADVAATLALHREPMRHRASVIGRTREQLTAALRAIAQDDVVAVRTEAPAVVFAFPGQGSQRAGMARDLYDAEPVFRDVIDMCARQIQPKLRLDIRTLLLARPDNAAAAEKLKQTQFTQPCILATELALARLWQSWGVQPTALVGHSVGEYVAACIAGVMSVEDALLAVSERGALVQAQPHGAMLAVRLGEAELAPLLPAACTIAAVNAPGMCVVAGPDTAIADCERILATARHPCRRLVTSHAFHSEMMDPVIAPLHAVLDRVRLSAPKIPIASTVSGTWMTDSEATSADYWARHARLPVRFEAALAAALQRAPAIVLEIGPGQTLVQLARLNSQAKSAIDIVGSQPLSNEQSQGSVEIAQAAARLWEHGVTIDWRARETEGLRTIVSLPGYPFARTRHWVDAPNIEEPTTTDKGTTPTLSTSTAPTTTPPTAIPTPAPAQARAERITRDLLGILESVSGNAVSTGEAGTAFLELGFDSLLLTQVTTLVRDQFGVSITFRQLLEDFSTPASLVAHLDSQMPPDPVAQITAASASPPLAAPSHIESLIQQQLELMQQQLTLLRGGVVPAQVPSSAPAAPPPQPSHQAQAHEPADTGAPTRHGPFRPVERTRGETLSSTQQSHLDALIAAYCERTAGSKRYAAEHRAHFTDPRAMSGFRPLWKEMVYPIVCERSRGPNLWDVDGNEYIDITMGFGVNFFGHTPDFVSTAIQTQLEAGAEIGPQTPLAGKVAQLLCELTGMDRATFCNTGSEAVMAAMRVARTVTGRTKIAIFSGDYHGMFDSVLVRGVQRNGEPHTLPIAPGIPRGLIDDIVVLEYGADSALEWIKSHGSELAAVIVEPVQSRNPSLQPRAFLHSLRELTRAGDTALVFDEVITGFRCHPGGAQAWFGVEADMATYGKVIGGGMPIGALAGRRRWMDALDGGHWSYGDESVPEVGVTFFAGTFVRHPLAMAASWAALNKIRDNGPALQNGVNSKVERFARELNAFFTTRGVDARVDHFASVFRIEFSANYAHAGLFFFHLRLRGIHFWEGRVGFLSTTHTDADVDAVIAAIQDTVLAMQDGGFLPTASTAVPTSGEHSSDVVIPLTEEQREMWMAYQMGPAISASFNESGILHFQRPLNEQALATAIRNVVQRHEGLRSIFLNDGSGQVVQPRMEVPVPAIDQPTDPKTRAAILLEQSAGVFDIEHGPAIRFLVMRAGDRADLIVTVSHLVCDGWSFNNVLRELGHYYSAAVANREAPPLPPAVQISTFAKAEPERAASPKTRAALAFWRTALADMPASLELPVDPQRSETPTFEGGFATHLVPRELADQVKALARSQRTTTFSLLFSAFGCLLHRLTGARDMLIGVPVSGQHIHNVPSLVGHCVNYLPIRHRVDPKHSFAEHLGQTSKALLHSFDHAQVSFGQLLREAKWVRDPSQVSPVGVTFNLDPPMGKIDFGGIGLELEINPAGRTNTDFGLNIVDGAEGFLIEADYSTERFDADTIQRWLAHFTNLLVAAVANASTQVGKLSLVANHARTAGVHASTQPVPCLLHTLFEAQVARTPDAIALEQRATSLSYRELDERANQLAHRLIPHGARPDTFVAIILERSVQFVVSMLAVLKSGAAMVPIDPAWPAERQLHVVRNCAARIVVARGKTMPAELPAEVVAIDLDAHGEAIALEPTEKPATETGPEHLAYVIYTSGSTGAPKGVMIEHRAISAHIPSIASVYGLTANDRSLLFHSVAFDPTVEQAFCAFHSGAKLIVRSANLWTGAEFAEKVVRCGLTVVDIPPRYWLQLLQDWRAEGVVPDLGNLRLIIVGGESLPPPAVHLWRELGLTHIRMINSYGPTECSVTATTHELPARSPRPGFVGRIPIGKPHGPVAVYVLSECQDPVPVGVKGELCIGGPTLARGYLGRDDLTSEKFIAHPFDPSARIYRTGDQARVLPDGTIEFLERIDRQVQLRGFRVELGEIESRLDEHPSVANAVVLALGNGDVTTELIAYIEPLDGADLTNAEIREHLSRFLPTYMIPARFMLVESFPVDGNGKIDRRALDSTTAHELTAVIETAAPRNATEEALVALWCRLLGRETVGIHDDFFELGGHSLLAMRMIKEIAAQFNHTLTLARLLSSPTIEALAKHIGVRATTSSASPPPARTQRGTILFNIPGIFGYGLLPVPLAQQIKPDRPYFEGLQLPGADGLEAPLETLEEMAGCLIGQIREVQPKGPYSLTGFCFGGLLAYEIACQLQQAGETVRGLVLWHAFPWYTWKKHSYARSLLELPKRLKAVGEADRMLLLRSTLLEPVRRLAISAGLKRAEASIDADKPPIYLANARACDKYRIRTPFSGRMHVARGLRLDPSFDVPPMGGWEQFESGALSIHDFDCEHLEFVTEPWLTQISALTAGWLREVDSSAISRAAPPPSGFNHRVGFPRPLSARGASSEPRKPHVGAGNDTVAS